MSLEQKPSEFYLRAYDLFAILVPGLVFVMIALSISWDDWIRASIIKNRIEGMSEGWFFGIVILAGFVSGHIIEGIGSLLDDIEWRLMSTIFGPQGWAARLIGKFKLLQFVFSVTATFVPLLREFGPQRREVCVDLCRALPKRRITFKNARQWALVFLSKHAPAEINYLIEQKDAQRKAVRNIAVLALLVFLCPSIRNHAFQSEAKVNGVISIAADENAALDHVGEAKKFWPFGQNSIWLLVFVVATWQRHSQLQWKYSQMVFDYFTAYYAVSHAEQVDDGGLHG